MESIIEVVKKRYSVRTYSSKEIGAEVLLQIKQYLEQNRSGPLGSKVRFKIVDATAYDKDELKKLGTYSLIKGARLFMAGAVEKNNTAMEDYGYCMEKNILMAASLGLGTCWLGGSLNRSTFAGKIGTSENEVIPAITPLGYPMDKKTIKDNLVRLVAGSNNRKSFEEIFYDGSIETPLDTKTSGDYLPALEAVRLAPSASNKQPWMVVKEKDKDNFHFYMNENVLYNNAFKDIKIQNLDMGIAMCHFELVSQELGLKGAWRANKPTLDAKGLKYIVSWETA